MPVATEVSTPRANKGPSILVKRHTGRRLYDTTNRRTVALAQLRNWAANGIAFAVIDAATSVDVTRVLVA